MHIGVCKLRLRFPENHSLKDKRRAVNSLTTRVRGSFNVSIAEVEEQDKWQLTTLGIACVSNSSQQVNEVLSKVVDLVTQSKFDVEILDYEIEVMPFS